MGTINFSVMVVLIIYMVVKDMITYTVGLLLIMLEIIIYSVALGMTP